jgi:hypothetical protein
MLKFKTFVPFRVKGCYLQTILRFNFERKNVKNIYFMRFFKKILTFVPANKINEKWTQLSLYTNK